MSFGKVIQVMGPSVDVEFEAEQLPQMLNALEVEMTDRILVLEVAQHIGDNIVRAIALASTDGLGYRIFLVRRYLAMDVIIPYVLWITLLGYLCDWSLRLILRRAYPWYQA